MARPLRGGSGRSSKGVGAGNGAERRGGARVTKGTNKVAGLRVSQGEFCADKVAGLRVSQREFCADKVAGLRVSQGEFCADKVAGLGEFVERVSRELFSGTVLRSDGVVWSREWHGGRSR